ncbi:MAG TPA: hypothetical protein VFW98_04560 [Gemmatimonadaceae bacterium]|nr:hypothetical protein [Gemmatimonadaceae bacterium]
MRTDMEYTPVHDPQPERPPYRPPIGVPMERLGRWAIPVSVAIHVAIVLFVLLASLIAAHLWAPPIGGSGGAGAAGGGGGGNGGTGTPHLQERLRYLRLQPSSPQPRATPHTAPPKPLSVPPPKTVPPPTVKPHVERTSLDPGAVRDPVMTAHVALPAGPSAALSLAGGVGTDGTAGNGPGRGGGTGSGVGTGHGSAVGPGSGGGAGTIYPPTPEFMLIPPIPIPDKVKGKVVHITFFIDAHGRPERVEFSSTGDGAYDRLLRSKLAEYRFKPATTAAGKPVAARYVADVRL